MKKVQDIKVYDAGDGFTVMITTDKREGVRTAVIYESRNIFSAERIFRLPVDMYSESKFMEMVEMSLPDYKYQVMPEWIRIGDETKRQAEAEKEAAREAAKEEARGTILLGRKKNEDNIADE